MSWIGLAGALLLFGCDAGESSDLSRSGGDDETSTPSDLACTVFEETFEGLQVLESPAHEGFTTQGELSLQEVPVSGEPFDPALEAKSGISGEGWDALLAKPLSFPVQRDEVALVSFWARCVEPPEGSDTCDMEVRFEKAEPPFESSMSHPLYVDSEWKQYSVPFEFESSYEPGEAVLLFLFGFAEQTVQFGDVCLVNLGLEAQRERLPKTPLSYPGDEPDAPWREAAEERINELRKGPLEVSVQDADGNPVEGARVSVSMTRHAFPFGTAVSVEWLDTEAVVTIERYKQEIKRLFNMVVLENALKWPALAGDWGSSYDFERAQNAVDWARGEDLPVRGHTLVWPSWENSPSYLQAFEGDPERLAREIEDHITELASQMAGQVVHWDVVNEVYTNHDLLDILGEGVLVDWFEAAHEADPEALLFINDFGILSGGGGTSEHRDEYERIIEFLLEEGAPLDGIGLQGHMWSRLTGPEDLVAILDRFAEFGLPLYITEYDISIDDLETSGRYTRDALQVFFSHPAVEGFLMWGFWDGRHWQGDAPLYTVDWTPKPAGEAYEQLLFDEWWTADEGETDADGNFGTSAFYGEYEIAAELGDQELTETVSHAEPGTELVLTLPD